MRKLTVCSVLLFMNMIKMLIATPYPPKKYIESDIFSNSKTILNSITTPGAHPLR